MRAKLSAHAASSIRCPGALIGRASVCGLPIERDRTGWF